MTNYLTKITKVKGKTTCIYKIQLASEFGKLWKLVSQTGITEDRRDKAASISKYVSKKYLNKETPFQGSKLEITQTLRGELVVAVKNLDKKKIDKYVSSKKIPNEREIYGDRLEKIVVKGIRDWCSDKVFEAFAEI